MAKEKIDPKINERLFSSDTDVVIGALQTIKQKGNKLYIPVLFDLLNLNPETLVENEIKQILATIKDKEAVEFFVDGLQNKKYRPILKSILTSCWQNGLDFSPYIPIFIQIVINEEWELAFEAFTIIDNLEFLPDKDVIEASTVLIKQNMESCNEQKKYFLEETLKKLS